jgi:uncharacterized protein (TIGR02001 family)
MVVKKYIILGAALWFFLVVLPPNLSAEFTLKADLVSSYIWRGFDLNPYERPVLQPSINYSLGDTGLSLELWGSFSFENKELHEFDFSLAYQQRLGKHLELAAGLIHYGWYFSPDFRFEDDTTHELFLSAALPGSIFSPGLAVFYDFHNGDGVYVLLQSDFEAALLSRVGLRLYASLGYNAGQWLAEGVDPGLSDLNLKMSVPISVGDFRVVPYAQYTFVLMEAISEEDYFLYGISVFYEREGHK